MSGGPGDGTEIWVLICERNHRCIAAARHHTQTPSGCLSPPEGEDLTPAQLRELREDAAWLYIKKKMLKMKCIIKILFLQTCCFGTFLNACRQCRQDDDSNADNSASTGVNSFDPQIWIFNKCTTIQRLATSPWLYLLYVFMFKDSCLYFLFLVYVVCPGLLL